MLEHSWVPRRYVALSGDNEALIKVPYLGALHEGIWYCLGCDSLIPAFIRITSVSLC